MTSERCDHCGTEFEPKTHNARFCKVECRKKFNNLRMTRGALLYDAVMKGRYNRKNWSDEHGKNWQSLTCDLARVWYGQDQGAGVEYRRRESDG